MPVIDEEGYRENVGIILVNNDNYLLWAKRIGQDAWQFPQGGVNPGEAVEQTLYRELGEELGLSAGDVTMLGMTRDWLRYRLPRGLVRHHSKPLCIGQKQKWFLLKLVSSEQKIRLNLTDKPEFDSWRWVDYWHPLQEVVNFKQEVYKLALKELETFLPKYD